MQPTLRKLTLPLLLVAAAQARPQAPDPATPTIHSSARIVVVDVVVTDKHNHPVHNLKRSDFTLLEDKAPQTIRNFEEHIPPTAGATFAPMPTLQPGIFVNDPGALSGGPANILLLDTLNTPLQDQVIVRQQLLDFVDKAHTPGRIAIFGLNSRLMVLQDFTTDPDVLRKAIKSPATIKASQALENSVTGIDLNEKLSDQLADDGNVTAATVARLATFEATQQTLKLQVRTRLTLDAMNQLARYLIGMPGRKNVIWFSGSFPITIMPDVEHTDAAIQISRPSLASNGAASTAANPFQSESTAEKQFRETAALLARSQIAVYPVQAEGLAASAVFSAEAGGPTAPKYTRNPNAFSVSQTAAFTQTAAADNTMLQLADETGGKAFLNGNGLAEAVASAIDTGSNYYTLSYTPASASPKDTYRKIQVNLDKQGYTLAYRRGYYVEPSDKPVDDDAPSALEVAMEDGAPSRPPHPATLPIQRSKPIDHPTAVTRSTTPPTPTPSGLWQLLKEAAAPSSTSPSASTASPETSSTPPPNASRSK
jgi:VWFA-related protein